MLLGRGGLQFSKLLMFDGCLEFSGPKKMKDAVGVYNLGGFVD